ncbi:DUF397 domain-containing protein [Nocardia otitidiscaviarum]|uniref:DUF397 domain-containing protein n=1 Tax=Nocardia otitidiscaviarum TaxID=1823 RepID=UPI0004A6CE59|nr:DUF397 domain-containing protein [Nocardia otitidiscaviarum]MBF6133809.1 DUF397 domain-containing protein [Nocardia otitidiscaviarum]MBF6487837.1 DUF397 domain-containing protein [Nocardia otitidiscaviarum]
MKGDLAGARWFKSSHSTASQDCVEVAILGSGQVAVRDSKHPSGPALRFSGAAWAAFTAALAGSEFDLP